MAIYLPILPHNPVHARAPFGAASDGDTALGIWVLHSLWWRDDKGFRICRPMKNVPTACILDRPSAHLLICGLDHHDAPRQSRVACTRRRGFLAVTTSNQPWCGTLRRADLVGVAVAATGRSSMPNLLFPRPVEPRASLSSGRQLKSWFNGYTFLFFEALPLLLHNWRTGTLWGTASRMPTSRRIRGHPGRWILRTLCYVLRESKVWTERALSRASATAHWAFRWMIPPPHPSPVVWRAFRGLARRVSLRDCRCTQPEVVWACTT